MQENITQYKSLDHNDIPPFNFTKSFKFNKVVSSFMILLNQAKHKKLTKACKEEIISLLEIYMPNIKSKLTT